MDWPRDQRGISKKDLDRVFSYEDCGDKANTTVVTVMHDDVVGRVLSRRGRLADNKLREIQEPRLWTVNNRNLEEWLSQVTSSYTRILRQWSQNLTVDQISGMSKPRGRDIFRFASHVSSGRPTEEVRQHMLIITLLTQAG